MFLVIGEKPSVAQALAKVLGAEAKGEVEVKTPTINGSCQLPRHILMELCMRLW